MASVVDGSGVPARPAHARLALPGASILGLGVLLAALLILPGQTVVTHAVDQLFLAFDGIHRVLSGQVPSRDFHTATGPLAVLTPALGHVISGDYGGALPAALAFNLLLITPVAAHVLASRLRPILALLTAAVLLLALAAPMHPTEPVAFLSFAGLPDRLGWTATALLLVMFAAPLRDGTRTVTLDAVAAAVLVLVAFYTRATHAVVALSFILLVLLIGRRPLWAGIALLVAALAAWAVELTWGGTRQYLADLLIAFQAEGWLRGQPGRFLGQALANPVECLLVGVIAALALWRDWSPRLLLFVLFCVVARFWLINQGDARWSTLTLYAAAAVLAEHLLRAMDRRHGSSEATLVNPAGVQLFFAALLLPAAVRCASALLLHLGTALAGGGTPLPLPGMDGVRLANLWSDRQFEGSNEHLAIVADGVAALSGLGLNAPRVLVLGGPNPFSAVLDLPPPTGNMIDMRWDAALDARHGVAPEDLLTEVDVVVERLGDGGSGRVGNLLRPALDAGFAPVAETEHWRLFRRTAQDGPGVPDARLPEGIAE